MPLTLQELMAIQDECMADDIDIDFAKMSLWDEDTARDYFESGGVLPAGAALDAPKPAAAPASAAPLPRVSDEEFKRWFPKWQKPAAQPKFRLVCFHNAGSSESVWTGRGMRQQTDNPFVVHCRDKGGELLAVELPGRESRRADKRETQLHKYAAALFPVLAPLLQEAESTPYVVIGHSMGTWLCYEFLRLLQAKGIPMPAQAVLSGFPSPDIAEAQRPWSRNAPMDDEAFKDECRGWDVNAVVFAPANWGTFSPMMRDDFTLFDAYEHPAAHASSPPFGCALRCYYAEKDKRVKKEHVEMWQRYGTGSFSVEQVPGNHLFFYDVPARATYMRKVVEGLPSPAFA